MTAPLSSLADHADERFTAEQRAKLAEFDAAPVPPEVVVETVARAIAESDGVNWDNYLTGMLGLPCDYRKNAAAAIAAMPASPAEQAVKRVEALAEEHEKWARINAQLATEDMDGSDLHDGMRMAQEASAARIRAALDPS